MTEKTRELVRKGKETVTRERKMLEEWFAVIILGSALGDGMK